MFKYLRAAVILQGVGLEKDLRVLLVLQRYYVDDVTFARAAREAGVSISELIDFMGKKDLPIVYEEADVVEGIKKVSGLLEERGVKSLLSMARASLSA